MRRVEIWISDDHPGTEIVTATSIAKILKDYYHSANLEIECFTSKPENGGTDSISIAPPWQSSEIEFSGDVYAKLKKAQKATNSTSILALLEKALNS